MLALDDGSTDPLAIAQLAEQGVQLILVPHAPSWSTTIGRSLITRRSLYGARFRSPAFARAVQAHLASSWTDTVQCEYGYMSSYLLDMPQSDAPALILDEHNLEWDLAGSGRAARPRVGLPYRVYTWRERRLRLREERAAAVRADRVLTVSPRDRDRLSALQPTAAISVVPNGVDTDAFRPSDRSEAQRSKGLVFIGKLDYGPNVDGILWFAREILPRIVHAHPDTTLSIVGRGAGDALRELEGTPRIRLVGEVSDTLPSLESAAVVIVPLRRGGGTRLKILEALAAGRPVVSTTVGAEGLDLPQEAIATADSAEEFAQSVADLLGDPTLRSNLASMGRAEVCRRFGWDTVVDGLEDTHLELAHQARRATRRHSPGQLL